MQLFVTHLHIVCVLYFHIFTYIYIMQLFVTNLHIVCAVFTYMQLFVTNLHIVCVLCLHIFAYMQLYATICNKFAYRVCAIFTYMQLFVSTKTRFGWQGWDHQSRVMMVLHVHSPARSSFR